MATDDLKIEPVSALDPEVAANPEISQPIEEPQRAPASIQTDVAPSQEHHVDIYDISGEKPVLGKIAPEEVTAAVASGNFSLPKGQPIRVISPDGEHGTIDAAEAKDAFANGYRYATPHEVKLHEFDTPAQQALTALEGAASAATFGLAPGLETALFDNSQEQLLRREENVKSHVAGEIGGLIGSAIVAPESGVTGIMERLGASGAAKVGLAAPTTTLAKIGSSAVKATIENAVFQSGDEVAKMMLADPNQTVGTAVTDIGLAALLGGGIGGAAGSAGALWNATMGSKTSGLLHTLAKKAGGIEGVTDDVVQTALDKSGMEIAPEVRARLMADPEIQQLSKTLEQSDTTAAGRSHQEALKAFRKDAGDTMVRAMGKDPEALSGLERSKYESGKSIGQQLAEEYEAQISPLSKEFEALREKYSHLELPKSTPEAPGTIAQISEKIAQLAEKEGWTASPSSEIMSEVNRVLKELPAQKTVKNLNDYISAVGDNMQSDPLNGPLKRAGGLIKGILKDAESSVIGARVGAVEGEQALQRYQSVRAAYARQAALKDALDDSIRVKGSVSGYAKSLREMAQTDGERLLDRVASNKDAHLLSIIREKFPKTAELIRSHHLDKVLDAATKKVAEGHNINPAALQKAIGGLSPEVRAFVLSPEAMGKIDSVGELLGKFNSSTHNFSNTARVADSLMGNIPAAAMAIATMLTGHNPATAAVVGALTSYLGKTLPDATRLALLKFMGSNQPVNSLAFKSTVDFIQSAIKGEHLINRASKNIFKAGREVLPQSMLPTEQDRKKIDKAVQHYTDKPESLTKIADSTNHYMPEVSPVVGNMAANAVQLLKGLRPVESRQSPLDQPTQPSAMQKAAYSRALDIAQQPLVIMEHIKNGTLLPQDLVVLKTIHPDTYNKISAKLTQEMVNAVHSGEAIPYKTKMSMSLFLGQALDSTMTPQAITAAQPLNQPQAPTGIQAAQLPKKHQMDALTKLPNQYKTQSQKAASSPNGSKN